MAADIDHQLRSSAATSPCGLPPATRDSRHYSTLRFLRNVGGPSRLRMAIDGHHGARASAAEPDVASGHVRRMREHGPAAVAALSDLRRSRVARRPLERVVGYLLPARLDTSEV